MGGHDWFQNTSMMLLLEPSSSLPFSQNTRSLSRSLPSPSVQSSLPAPPPPPPLRLSLTLPRLPLSLQASLAQEALQLMRDDSKVVTHWKPELRLRYVDFTH